MSTQSFGRLNTTLHTIEMVGGEDGYGPVAERHGMASRAGGVMERVVGEEQVDGCGIPHDPDLAVASDDRFDDGSSAAAPSWASGPATSANRSVGTNTLRSMSIVARGSA